MHHISMDAVQEGVRHLFVDDPFQILRTVHFEGWAEFKRRGTQNIVQHDFSANMNELDLARKAVLGMLDHYERSRTDVGVEGLHITPEWVHSLHLSGFEVVAAFVGYTNPNYVEDILEHAKNNEHDWVNEWLSIHNGDDTKLRSWVEERAQECRETATVAEKYDYPFFDASAKPFHEYVNEVQVYLSAH